MKRIFILSAAALMVSGSYSPVQAITVNDPGYFNKCMIAYVNDPATYDRDCDKSMDSLTKAPIEPVPIVVDPCEPDLGAIDPLILMLRPGERVQIASAPCPK